MLPSVGGRDKNSAFQTMVYSLFLIPMAVVPYIFHFAGVWATLLLVISSIVLVVPSVKLYRDCDMKSAQRLMFGSFIYLPVIQIILVLDKFF
jgi:protoheme IX farnesyltransferase